MQTTTLNPIQKHLLQMFSYLSSESMLDEVKSVLLRYYASKMQKDIDKYWEENHMDESSVEAILNEHLRTPYSHA